ncbi:MAG: hypothetical protein PUD89_03115 [Bacteroidales bacterium]|nr:hypothetical protein [Bacteroidales bacterium]
MSSTCKTQPTQRLFGFGLRHNQPDEHCGIIIYHKNQNGFALFFDTKVQALFA